MLFPTLIATCFENEENKKIIEQEVSCALLENYIEVRKTVRLFYLRVLHVSPVQTIKHCQHNVKWPNLKFYGEHEHTAVNFPIAICT